MRSAKKAIDSYIYANTKFLDCANGVDSNPPSIPHDEYGIRMVPPNFDAELGDIVVKESQFLTLLLLQKICKAITEIVNFYNHPNVTDPAVSKTEGESAPSKESGLSQTEYPAVDSAAIPLNDELIILVYRYLVGIFDCSELFTLDGDQSREQVVVCCADEMQLNEYIQHYSSVLSALPGDVKRTVLATAFPHIYECTKKNPILLDFIRQVVSKTLSTHYTSIVLIDFIISNMAVFVLHSFL